MKRRAIILCAGSGSRFGGNKLLAVLEGKEVFLHSLESFATVIGAENIILCVPHGQEELFRQLALSHGFAQARICSGGSERYLSVLKGLNYCEKDEWVAVHDAARPFISAELIEKVYVEAKKSGGAILCKKVTDTIKKIDELGHINTPKRDQLYAAETPQTFVAEKLKRAIEAAIEAGVLLTDDAHAIEFIGASYALVPHQGCNNKITYSADLKQ